MTKNYIWLRQELSGAWAMPFAFTNTLPREVPQQLRDKLESSPYEEIHLPYREKYQELTNETPLRLMSDMPGRALLVPAGAGPEYLLRYQIMLAVATAFNGVSEPRFRLSDGGGTALAGRESIGWQNPPLEREHSFFPVYITVSRAFQATLRERFATSYFADLERLKDPQAAGPALVFAATSPYLSKARSAFTYEVLDNEAVEKFYRSAARNLPRILRDLQPRLAANADSTLAAMYAPTRSREIIDNVKRDRNPMRSLLLAESLLFDVFFRFTHKMRDLQTAPRGVRSLATATDEFVFELRSRLRRFYNSMPMYELAMPLFLSTTHALFETRSAVECAAVE